MFGVSNNRFQIPNVPGQAPDYRARRRSTPSTRRRSTRASASSNRFEVLSLPGHIRATHRLPGLALPPRHRRALSARPGRRPGLQRHRRRRSSAATAPTACRSTSSIALGDAHTLRDGVCSQRRALGRQQHVAGVPGRRRRQPDQHHADHDRRRHAAHRRAHLSASYLQDEWQPAKRADGQLRPARYDKVDTVRQRRPAQPAPRRGLRAQPTTRACTPAMRATSRRRPPRRSTPPRFAKFQGTTNALPSRRRHRGDVGTLELLRRRLSHQIGDARCRSASTPTTARCATCRTRASSATR